MATEKTQVEKFQARHRELHGDVIKELKRQLGRKRVDLEKEEADFDDEAGNRIVKVDRVHVHFDGTMETYPIGELGIDDALYILGVITR